MMALLSPALRDWARERVRRPRVYFRTIRRRICVNGRSPYEISSSWKALSEKAGPLALWISSRSFRIINSPMISRPCE